MSGCAVCVFTAGHASTGRAAWSIPTPLRVVQESRREKEAATEVAPVSESSEKPETVPSWGEPEAQPMIQPPDADEDQIGRRAARRCDL